MRGRRSPSARPRIRRVLLVLAATSLVVGGGPLLTGGRGRAAAAGSSSGARFVVGAAAQPGQTDTKPGEPSGPALADRAGSRGQGALPGVSAEIQRWQRRLNGALARQLRLVRRREPGAVAAVLLVALAYGVIHALGPGHGKAVVASLFLGRHAHPIRGVAVGFLVSFLQILSSIVAVSLLAFMLGHGSLSVARETAWIEVVSYALVAALGLWMTARALADRGHDHGAVGDGPCEPPAPPATGGGPRGPRAAASALVLAAGLTPCPSGIIVLLFALANQVFGVGLEACLVMALGMGTTVGTIGLLTILVRRAALAPLRRRSRALAWTSRGLAVAGSMTLTVVGGLLCLGAWSRLP